MQRFHPSLALIARLFILWLLLLGCRTSDVFSAARANFTPTRTVTRTVRPTFTRVPPTLPPSPTLAPTPIPTIALPSATRAPTPRPSATAKPSFTSPPPPTATPDLYHGYYYRVAKNVCTTAQNTRAEGTVFNNGVPQDGVIVRIANGDGGDPVINDFVTGVDPSDYKHIDPSLKGKYRLGIAEGQTIAGNWWVFLINSNGAQISVGAYFNTHDTPGCNTAYIDFAHN